MRSSSHLAAADAYNEEEKKLQTQVRQIEDEIGATELKSFNVEAVLDYLRDFYRSYAGLERRGSGSS